MGLRKSSFRTKLHGLPMVIKFNHVYFMLHPCVFRGPRPQFQEASVEPLNSIHIRDCHLPNSASHVFFCIQSGGNECPFQFFNVSGDGIAYASMFCRNLVMQIKNRTEQTFSMRGSETGVLALPLLQWDSRAENGGLS